MPSSPLFDTKLPHRFSVEDIGKLSDHHSADLGWPLQGTCGVVLDIDGVIHRIGEVIEGSDEAIRRLQELQIPFCFMTNTGGEFEADKAEYLSKLLHTTILPEQVIMANTPMKFLAERYSHDTVLIGGPRDSVNIARSYGFHGAISMHEFQQQHPELVPFRYASDRTNPPVEMPRVAAIFFMGDMEDAFNDIQVTLDVLMSIDGRIGAGVAAEQSVPIYMHADDMFWMSSAPLPRLAEGAFREMLAHIYKTVSGHELHITQFGKPRRVAYAYAEHVLRAESRRLGWNPGRHARHIYDWGQHGDRYCGCQRRGRAVDIHARAVGCGSCSHCSAVRRFHRCRSTPLSSAEPRSPLQRLYVGPLH